MAVSPAPRHGAGAFSSSPLPPKLDTEVPTKSHIFQPPKAPASSYPSQQPFAFRSSKAEDDGSVNGSRKRARADSSYGQATASLSPMDRGWAPLSTASSIFFHSTSVTSPPPLVNTQYVFAGGLESPSSASASGIEKPDEISETSFRRRWSMSCNQPDDDMFIDPPPVSPTTGSKRKHEPPSGGWSESLGKIVWNFVGFTGKVWSFCTSAPFKGFYAGGGQGYDIKHSDEEKIATSGVWEDVREKPRSTASPADYASPTEFRERTNITDYFSTADSTLRPNKRLHTERGSEWVMVGGRNSFHTPSPKSYLPRPVRPVSSKSASVARPSLIPASRRGARVAYPGPSSGGGHRASPSLASPRRVEHSSKQSGSSSPTKPSVSHLSPEAQKYAARRRREEFEADASYRRLNAQLKAMIREGKEALNTKIEIEEAGRDDGGCPEECYDQSAKVW